MSFWDGRRVLVTGGAGFIGSHVVEEILRRSARARVRVADDLSTGSRENLKEAPGDLRFMRADCRDLGDCLKACRGQDIVLNLAAKVAGVGYNAAHQATMFRDNMAIAANMIEAARRRGVGRFLEVSSACVYARHCPVPTPESEGFTGRPEPSNEGYGWAKRMGEFLAQAYGAEFGLEAAIARPYNTYGPRDHFDSPDSHVIAALIRRAAAGENPLTVWGDGTHTRAFLYVTDAARGLVDAAERGPAGEPVNLGTDEEVTIRDLAGTILRLSGSKAKLRFDPSKPSGQPRRNCDTSKAKKLLGFEAKVSLEEGLRRTIEWYLSSRRKSSASGVKRGRSTRVYE